MKKIIFTSLLLITPLCKAADPAAIAEYIAKVKVGPDAWADVTQYLDYYHKIYTARALGSEELNLNGYEIETIPTNLPEQLRHLELNNNQIQTIGNLNCSALRLLSLNNNLIQTIGNLDCPELRWLYLDNNLIQTIDNLNCPNLWRLDLNNNKIQAIDPQVLDQFPHLHILELNQNYLSEDNIEELQAYAADRENLTIDFGEQKKGVGIKGAKR